MILIRGIKGETYARKIEKGVVDCRDILSALLKPPVTGYEYSDYYEKNLVKALTFFSKGEMKDFHNPNFLYSIFSDFYIPHIYLTYFHILNEGSLEWLDKFDDDYLFIAIDVKIDKNTQAAIGNSFFGTRMTYVDSIRQLRQDGTCGFYAACLCSLDHIIGTNEWMLEPPQVYNTLCFSLLCREQDEKFTDIENEFRIIAYDCPQIQNGIRKQIPRGVTLFGKNGIEYKGVLHAGQNSVLKSNLCLLRNPYKSLRDILIEEQGNVTVDSKFKSISIDDISGGHRYLGGKTDCEKYMKKMIQCMPEDIYVNRTVRKVYKKSDILKAACFAPGYHKVVY